MTYSLRRADLAKHSALILALDRQCFPDDSPVDIEPSPLGGPWAQLVWIDGAVAGYSVLQRMTEEPSCGYLSRAGVLPAHRGRGLQLRMIRHRINLARRLGLSHVISDTHCNPASSNNLYRAGFLQFEPANPWGLPHSAHWILDLYGHG